MSKAVLYVIRSVLVRLWRIRISRRRTSLAIGGQVSLGLLALGEDANKIKGLQRCDPFYFQLPPCQGGNKL